MSIGEPTDAARLVHSFVNTLDLRAFKRHGAAHERVDRLGTPGELASWLREHGLVGRRVRATRTNLDAALRLRARLRRALGDVGDGTWDAVPDVDDWPLKVSLGGGRSPELVVAGPEVEAALGRIALAAVDAVGDGSWRRLKVCAAGDCRWVFYDRTKPGRGRWCDPALCGNRMKTRAYRQRKRDGALPSDDSDSTFG